MLAARAKIYLDTNAFGKSIQHYKKALDYGDDFYEPKHADSASSAEPQKVPGTDKWKAYHPKIQKAVKEAKKQRDIAKYGKGFAYWRIARRAHLNGNYKKAATQYELITRMFPKSIYAQGAGYWRAITHLERGNKEKCVEALQAFIDEQPLGLFRGKALYKIAVIRLHRDWNPQAAYKAFRRTLQWIKKVRNRQKDIELYVPKKAREVTKPPPQPLKKTDSGALVPADVKPRHLTCRRTADWYLRRLAWRVRFHLGFLAFVDEEYDTAKQQWTAGFKLNKQLREQHGSQIGSFYRRLMNACRGKRFIATRREMKAFTNRPRLRLKLMTGDFYALWLRWNRAEHLYKALLDSRDITAAQKAVVLRCLAAAKEHQKNLDKSTDYLSRIIDNYRDTAAGQEARRDYARLCTQSGEEKAEILLQVYDDAPSGSETRMNALLDAVIALYEYRKYERAERLCRKFAKQYPDTRHSPLAKELVKELSAK